MKHLFYIPMYLFQITPLIIIITLVFIFDNRLFVMHNLKEFYTIKGIKQQYQYFINN